MKFQASYSHGIGHSECHSLETSHCGDLRIIGQLMNETLFLIFVSIYRSHKKTVTCIKGTKL